MKSTHMSHQTVDLPSQMVELMFSDVLFSISRGGDSFEKNSGRKSHLASEMTQCGLAKSGYKNVLNVILGHLCSGRKAVFVAVAKVVAWHGLGWQICMTLASLVFNCKSCQFHRSPHHCTIIHIMVKNSQHYLSKNSPILGVITVEIQYHAHYCSNYVHSSPPIHGFPYEQNQQYL